MMSGLRMIGSDCKFEVNKSEIDKVKNAKSYRYYENQKSRLRIGIYDFKSQVQFYDI